MACLSESDLQGYLEESGPTPLREMVGEHLVSCAHCRAEFERVVATHQRVNTWFAELASPADDAPIDVASAFASVMKRIEMPRVEMLRRVEADDHLNRLLAPDTETPWYKSIIENIREVISPEKLPPLELTSQPVEVKDIWGKGTNPKALASSVFFQVVIVGIMLLLGTTAVVKKAVQITPLIAPPVIKPMEAKPSHGGGGGQRSPLPPIKAPLPKPALKVFTPPMIPIPHPALTMDPSLIAPPDNLANSNMVGNPLGAIGGAGGFGSGGGIGNGRGGGIGNGNGSGSGGGSGGGAYNVGNGVSAPVPIVKPDPEYSEEARKAKYSGEVQLSIVVTPDGKATDIKVVKSLGMGLDEKAVEAIQKWRFKPGTKNGVPVPVKALVAVNFRLL